jgi:YggT family protein
MYSLLGLISTVIQIYIYILIASAVLSWLIAFNVVNTRNQAVAMIADALWRLTEPVLRPIRRVLPNFGGRAHPAPLFRAQPAVRDFLRYHRLAA